MADGSKESSVPVLILRLLAQQKEILGQVYVAQLCWDVTALQSSYMPYYDWVESFAYDQRHFLIIGRDSYVEDRVRGY